MIIRSLSLVIAVLALGSGPAEAGQGPPPRAEIGAGTLEGTWVAPHEAVFRGIRYGAPPVGDLRWKPPVASPVKAGVQPAHDFGPACVQSDRLTLWSKSIAMVFGTQDKVPTDRLKTDEDCLYLNVWTTNLRRAGSAREPAPVMVWIHGGSNLNGEGSSPWYDGAALARRGAVVVTINYRLGIFGFLAHPALSAERPERVSGNYGLLDQLEALRWVKRHIAAFGGDPNRVTVFGESAGSIDILALVASPASAGLFHRAIAESGAPMGQVAGLAAAEAQASALGAALGADTAGGVLAALRSRPAAEVQLMGERLLLSGKFRPGPIVDGWLLPAAPGQIFASGQQRKIPLLIGTNAREMTTLRYYLPQFERTISGYRKWLSETTGPLTDRLFPLYPATADAGVEPALIDFTTDLYFTCPSRFAARTMSAAGSPTFLYQFTRVLPGGESLGAYHAAEIGYVFGNRLAWLPWEPVDEKLSNTMSEYWIAFARDGTPAAAGLPEWPRYDPISDRYLELGPTIGTKSGLRKAACDLIDPTFPSQWAAAR